MYKKLHIKMTLFCGTVTGLILLLMTLTGLLAFENLLDKNDAAVHDKTVHALITSLDSEPYIDYDKIAKLADTRYYTVVLYDKSASYSLTLGQEKQMLIEESRERAMNEYGLNVKNPPVFGTSAKQLEFPFTVQKKEYLASFASIPHKYGTFCAVIVYSREQLYQQTGRLRLFFLIIDTTALLLLFTAAWFYTGRMLLPLEENRRKQIQFVASASHELRSPLAVLLSSSDALAVAYDAQERQGFHEIIKSEGNRMSQLINDMLSLASADNQSWPMHLESTALDELVPELYEKYHPLANAKGLALKIKLPSPEEIPAAVCDRQRIVQILGIFLDNAISYTPKGGSITLGLSPMEGGWKLWVADTGPGIPDEWKDRIFERFFRADPSREDRRHFGLGLSIAAEITRLHGGRIWAEDNPGGGTVFSLWLPGKAACSDCAGFLARRF